MSYQLYPQPYAQYLMFKSTFKYAGLPSAKTVCVPRFHKSQALQVAAALRRLARVGGGGINGAAVVWWGYTFAAKIRSDSFRFHLVQSDQARLSGRLDFPENQAVL